MSLVDDVLIGAQEPRVVTVPPAASRADADDAAYLASQYNLMPIHGSAMCWRAGWDPRLIGAGRRRGCDLSVPRQCGKTEILTMRTLYGMVLLGEPVLLHTAHEVKTAQKAFRRYIFDNIRMFPKLNVRTTLIRKANGQECITRDNGGSFELVARSRGSGRGFSVRWWRARWRRGR